MQTYHTILRTKYSLQYCITILVSGGFTYVGIPSYHTILHTKYCLQYRCLMQTCVQNIDYNTVLPYWLAIFNISYNIANKILFTIQMINVDISYNIVYKILITILYYHTGQWRIYLCRNSLHTDGHQTKYCIQKILFTIFRCLMQTYHTILRTKYCLQYCITILVSGGFTYVGIPYTQTRDEHNIVYNIQMFNVDISGGFTYVGIPYTQTQDDDSLIISA